MCDRPIVKVVEVNLKKHPYADNLSIATIEGYQCVVRTADFENVKIAAYIPVDSIVPATEEWEFMKSFKYRVKTVKIRGIYSQGLLVPVKPGSNWKLDDDVAEELNIIKYEPMPPVHLSGEQIKNIAGFISYPHIENWRSHPKLFVNDEVVIITEKIHGTNVRYGLISTSSEDLSFCVGSHKTCRDPKGSNIYAAIGRKFNIENKIKEIAKELKTSHIIIFGEIFGKGIQDLTYGMHEPSLMIFDIWIDGSFLDYQDIKYLCNKHNLPIVPELYVGSYSEKLLEYANGQAFKGDHIKEGIVIRSFKESWDIKVGRRILKYKSLAYETRKHGTEFH